KYSTLNEDQIRKQLLSSAEHKDMVKKGSEYEKLKTQTEQLKTKNRMLEGKIDDQLEEFKQLNILLKEKNKYIQKIRSNSTSPYFGSEDDSISQQSVERVPQCVIPEQVQPSPDSISSEIQDTPKNETAPIQPVTQNISNPPSIPDLPDISRSSSTPEVPDTSSPPSTSELPDISSPPSTPEVPGISSPSSTPEVPGISSPSSTPSIQTTPTSTPSPTNPLITNEPEKPATRQQTPQLKPILETIPAIPQAGVQEKTLTAPPPPPAATFTDEADSTDSYSKNRSAKGKFQQYIKRFF
ncbi:MAG: hypothetical protein U9Q67_00045, partial [Patescibacteria group bacterium]|nr:hypothetical protein [Patescibacteria group bacterium]